MSEGFIEAKRVYVVLVNVCIACLVLSTGNRKKMLGQAPSRANRLTTGERREVEVDDGFRSSPVCSPDAET